MAFSFSFSCLVVVLAACLHQTTAQDTTHEGCIHMPIIHSTNTQYFGKRAVSLSLSNRSDIAYYAKRTVTSPPSANPIHRLTQAVNIGNPAQPVYVQLDTGSFELWVNPQCATLDLTDTAFCQTVGQYDTTLSSTSVDLGTAKTLRYGIGSANITYFTDDIAMPGSSASPPIPSRSPL